MNRVDHEDFSGDTVNEIKRLIRGSIAVIADISESRPNVLFEIGYARGLNKPVVQLCSTSIDDIPFNIRNDPTIPYTIGQTNKLRKKLGKKLKGILS